MNLKSLVSVVILSLTLLNSCAKQAQENRNATAGKDHYRNALIALDQGNESQAESELNNSLKADPLNDRARVTLASLYAKQAGITLKDWLDPFLEAAKLLTKPINTLSLTGESLDDISKEARSLSQQSAENLTDSDRATRDAALKLTGSVAKLALGITVAMDLFHTIPLLNETQMGKLDKAIETLRLNGTPAVDRPEETRLYQAVLGFVRFVNHVKRLVGDANSYRFSAQRQRLCSLNGPMLRYHLTEIRKSLRVLSEGLVSNPTDPDSIQKTARMKLKKMADALLGNPVQSKIEDILNDRTPEGRIAKLASEQFCKGITPNNEQPPSQGKTIDPDEPLPGLDDPQSGDKPNENALEVDSGNNGNK